MDSLARMLPGLVRQAEDSPEVREYAAFAAWRASAGQSVRSVCAPVALAGRRLLIATVDQTWKAQLDRLAPQFIFRINSLLGAPIVTQVVFRVDTEAVRAAHPGPISPQRGDVRRFVSELAPDAEAIGNDELREAFLRAAASCLARRSAETETAPEVENDARNRD